MGITIGIRRNTYITEATFRFEHYWVTYLRIYPISKKKQNSDLLI